MKHRSFLSRLWVFLFVVASLFLSQSAGRAAEWQWSVPDAGSQVYLWIPPNCERVRAVVFSNHNMTEQGMLEHPAMRKTLGELGMAEVWVAPGLGVKFDFNNGDQQRFERIMNALAEASGYSELATAPIVPMGHSANATWVWNFAAWNPGRTLAVVSFHGDAPRTLLTGYGAPNVDWGERTIEGVPGLMVMGEYEWWDARMWPALVYTAKFPKTPIAFLADAGHGHFDYVDRTVEFIAKFIAKAAAARLPTETPLDKPSTLKPVDPKIGWLVARWRKDLSPIAPAAPYSQYSGETGEAFWCFDEEMAKQTEAIYAEQRGKKLQRLIVKDYSSTEGKAVGEDNKPRGLMQEDGRTFRLSAEFAASDNGKPLGHATGGGPIRFSKIVGPAIQTGPETFQFSYGRAEYPADRRNNDVWIVAHQSGDADYKSAVQQIKIYFRPNSGATQLITFPAIGEQKASIQTLKLGATSDSGLPVSYYVVSGPAEIEGDTLRFTAIPPRAKFPVKVIVTAWQWGRATEPKVQTATPVTQEFLLYRPNPTPMNTMSFSPTAGFLFATFHGHEETPLSEQVYFGFSENGRNWELLNNDNPILISQLGEKGARDPFLVRSPDGSRFWVIATDLSWHLQPGCERAVRQGSRSILIWESTDLAHWSEPRLAEIAASDAGCAWAPEAIWDEQRGQFLVFWASTTAGDDFSKQRIWAATTRDFESFSEPFIWIEKATHVIDTDVVRDGQHYFRFSKDDQHKSITCEMSDDLLGEWQEVTDFSLSRLEDVEGPLCFALGDGTWCLLLDFFVTRQGYKPFLTRDLAGGQWVEADDFSFQRMFRHGGILPISSAERERLRAFQ